MSNLYKNIECLCAQNDSNVTQLCKEVGISRSTLSELSAGRTKDLSSEVKRKIAQYFWVNVEFLDKEYSNVPCPECGLQYHAGSASEENTHSKRHMKWKKAVEKYGFCWNAVYRSAVKSKVYDLLAEPGLPSSKKVDCFKVLLKTYFSRALETVDYDTNRSFNEYAAAFVKQENGCFPKKSSDEYKKLLDIFGEKTANLNGTYFADSDNIPFEREDKYDGSIIIERFNQLCLKRGINKTSALAESGAGDKFVQHIKSGSAPSIEKCQALAEYFNVSIDYLVGNTDYPYIVTAAEMEELKNPNLISKNIAAYGGAETLTVDSDVLKAAIDKALKEKGLI